MVRTRVLLVDMPQMLREIVRELVSAERDMEVVGEVGDRVPSLAAVRACGAEFVIAGGSGPELAAACESLLAGCPELRVLALSTDGRSGALHENGRNGHSATALGELAPDRLVGVVRGAVRGELSQEGS